MFARVFKKATLKVVGEMEMLKRLNNHVLYERSGAVRFFLKK